MPDVYDPQVHLVVPEESQGVIGESAMFDEAIQEGLRDGHGYAYSALRMLGD